MNYKLDKYNLFTKVFETVLKDKIEPKLVFIDTIKYIDGYFNQKMKIYIVVDDDIFYDDVIKFDGMEIHIKAITLSQILSVQRYKVSMVMANLNDGIAVLNDKNVNDIIISIMNGVTPLDVLESLQYRINSASNSLTNEKELNSYNKNLIARTLKAISLFVNIYEGFDILNGNKETIEALACSDVILSLMTNKPMMELVQTEEVKAAMEKNQFENLKKQIKENTELINNIMADIKIKIETEGN